MPGIFVDGEGDGQRRLDMPVHGLMFPCRSVAALLFGAGIEYFRRLLVGQVAEGDVFRTHRLLRSRRLLAITETVRAARRLHPDLADHLIDIGGDVALYVNPIRRLPDMFGPDPWTIRG